MKIPSLRGIARAYLMSIAFWCGIALLMVLQYRPFNRQNPWAWFADLVEQMALRGVALTFWTPPVFYVVGNYLSFSQKRIRYVLLWSMGAILFVLLQTSILWLLVRPYDDVLQAYGSRSFHSWVEMIRSGFADQIFIYIAIVVAAHAYEYLKRLRRQEREGYEYQQALAASELQALKTQLHPHFLFNTLHGIATLVDSEPKNAQAMIIKLSNLLRKSLERENADLIYLRDEIRFVGEYVDLETMRLGNRLKIEWHIAPETMDQLVPQMILQPLVENAIRHGVACSREGGWITIASTQRDGFLEIQVRNSVGGNRREGTGVGLRNAEARLKYLYSGEASLRFTMEEDHVATVNLVLPALIMRTGEEFHAAAGREGKETVCESSSSMTSH